MLINQYILSVKHIHNDKERIEEGELRCTQLKKHLEATNSQKAVFISEDASGVVKKVIYDSQSDKLIGLVLPLNEANGMPILSTFQAKSVEDIEQYMTAPQSTLVYIVVAQPLTTIAPPFILQIFGTNNKFEALDVLKCGSTLREN